MVKQRLNPNGELMVNVIGNAPEFAGVPKAMLTSAFHWYAMWAYQYVNTVGTIAYRQDKSREMALKYVERVIPEVKTFRDKVAAHFAWNTKNKNDSDAERSFSIISLMGFQNESFVMGGPTLVRMSAGKVSDSRDMLPWSISKIHGRLRERYWPSDRVTGQP